jgi:hypothetical protein
VKSGIVLAVVPSGLRVDQFTGVISLSFAGSTVAVEVEQNIHELFVGETSGTGFEIERGIPDPPSLGFFHMY